MHTKLAKLTSRLLVASIILPVILLIAPSINSLALDTRFPDDAFREYVYDNFDTDHDGHLTGLECDNVKRIDVENIGIESLKGIEYFQNLIELYCGTNHLKELNLRTNSKLTTLCCESNSQLEKLVLPESKSLKFLICSNCNLSGSLDLCGFQDLNWVDIGYNSITEFYIDHLTSKLTFVDCSYNELSSLATLAHSEDLQTLICYCNKLESLSLSKFSKLERLDCASNYDEVTGKGIKSLNLSNNPKLQFLDCQMNILEGCLDLSGCPELNSLTCNGNKLTGLNLSANPKLEYLSARSNKINSLDLSNNTLLQELIVNDNEISSIDVCNLTALELLGLGFNPLSEIDLSNNLYLRYLTINNTNINSLNLSDNIELREVYASNNPKLSSITISNCINLEDLSVESCPIASLDVSNLPNLLALDCCNVQIETLDISKNPLLMFLNCGNNKLTDLDVSNNPSMNYLYCSGNKIPVLYIANNTKLIDAYQNGGTSPNGDFLSTDYTTRIIISDEGWNTRSGAFLNRLYLNVMDRDPDDGGKLYWLDELTKGQNGGDVAKTFFISNEFTSKTLSDEKFLEILYTTFFDRGSDKDGKDFWLNDLANGVSRDYVVSCFINSGEWSDICLTYGIRSGSSVPASITITPSAGVIDFVNRIYTECLGRPAEKEGFDYWCDVLANLKDSGINAGMNFFESEEFVNFNLDNAEFVRRLYRTFMNRDAEVDDPNGFNYWVGVLESGETRHDVIRGFANCPEFFDICSGYGILAY